LTTSCKPAAWRSGAWQNSFAVFREKDGRLAVVFETLSLQLDAPEDPSPGWRRTPGCLHLRLAGPTPSSD